MAELDHLLFAQALIARSLRSSALRACDAHSQAAQ
jgi:hypothetical protein